MLDFELFRQLGARYFSPSLVQLQSNCQINSGSDNRV